MSPTSYTAAAWALTRAISPRDRVRVASVDAGGTVLNQYAASRRINGPAPTAPWAVHLADPHGFRLIAFDLDAKHGPGQAATDADAISQLLTGAGIDHLVTRSGPSDGRHVWLALTSPAPAELVGTLARLVAAWCPSLDLAPLSNPATGCVRPPGAPHRDGGTAELLTGDTHTLTHPSTSPDQLQQLAQHLAAAINGSSPDATARSTSTAIDPAGHPYLPGTRRPLPPGSLAALHQHPGHGDASSQLWKVLVGAAAHHWHLADIAEHVTTAPGLEHLRTRRGSSGHRTPRHPRDQAATLARQWGYAVAFAASHPRSTGTDSSFDTRAGEITDTVRAQQERADASPGRWNHGGGPADRRVLDTLHLFALTAVTATVEADIRRIALTCGIGRETARVALHRLTTDGWITKTRDAAGVHGATWTITPQPPLHKDIEPARSQAATRPAGAGAAERTLQIETLTHRIRLLNHDTFTTAHALPHAAGNSYARLSPTHPRTPTDPTDADLLDRLRQHGLAQHTPHGWTRTAEIHRDTVAARLGITGRLADRRTRYLAERDVWSWWQAEHDWMTTTRPERTHRRPAQQNPLWQPASDTRYPKHPRRPDGRADYSAARAAHARGALDAITLAA